MAFTHYTRSNCSLSTGSEDDFHQESDLRSPRLCLWPDCLFLTNTLAKLEHHVVHKHGCLPARHRAQSQPQQLEMPMKL
jgi:hypothetical protein